MTWEFGGLGAVWFTLAFLAAAIAQGRGRSGFSWFILTIFLGPIAAFFLVVLDPLKKDGE